MTNKLDDTPVTPGTKPNGSIEQIDEECLAQGSVPDAENTEKKRKFNISDFRLNVDYSSIEENDDGDIFDIEERKPRGLEFFRTHPELSFPVRVIDLKENGGKYLLLPALYEKYAEDSYHAVIHLCVSRDRDFFLWVVRIPDGNSRFDSLFESAVTDAAKAKTLWVRRQWIKTAKKGRHETTVAKAGVIPEPCWPANISIEELVAKCFGEDCWITNENHEVLQRLRGEK